MTRTYDPPQVARNYAAARALPAGTLDLWMRELRGLLPTVAPIRSVLDLGCGTGRFTGPLSAEFGCPVVGVDPSVAMLNQARSGDGGRLSWVVGSAEDIPLGDDSIDLIWMSQVFHHLDNRSRAFLEVHRVVRPGGFLAIRNGTQETDREIEWWACFPEVVALEKHKTPVRQDIERAGTAQGLAIVAQKTVYQVFASSYLEYYDKINQRGLSSLITISDDAFNAGMNRLRTWASTQPPDQTVLEPVDFFLFKIAK